MHRERRRKRGGGAVQGASALGGPQCWSAAEADLRDPERRSLAREAAALAPDDYGNWIALGMASCWKGCVTALDRVTQLASRPVPSACFVQAMAHWQLDDWECARRCYDQGVQRMEKERGDETTQPCGPRPARFSRSLIRPEGNSSVREWRCYT